ncbi:MAG: histidine--tRNA ligase, partial [Bacillota bacterium]
QRRHKENPLRVLDCKVDQDNPVVLAAPKPLDYLTDSAKYHFDHVVLGLESLGLNFEIDKNLVRGLDYYTHTVFEIISESDKLGSQSTLVGGGRYNDLISDLDGPDTPAVGFAFGAERIILALENSAFFAEESEIHAYFINLDNVFENDALKIINDLRLGGLIIDYDFLNRSLKAQFKQADRVNARYYLIYGEKEASEHKINVKNAKTGEQETVNLDDLYQYLLSKFQNSNKSKACEGCNGC